VSYHALKGCGFLFLSNQLVVNPRRA
jgi:hypothetical protein